MPQRVRSVHGHFITVEEKAKEDAERAAKFAWAAPDVVCDNIPDYPGYKIVSLRHPDDLVLFGQLMHHCAGSHVKWVTQERIWHFLTVLDSKGEPHVTVHLKDKEWMGKPHPDDNKGFEKGVNYYVGPHNNGEKYAVSSCYETRAHEAKEFTFEGKRVLPMSIAGKYQAYGTPAHETATTALKAFNAWLEAQIEQT